MPFFHVFKTSCLHEEFKFPRKAIMELNNVELAKFQSQKIQMSVDRVRQMLSVTSGAFADIFKHLQVSTHLHSN